MASQAVTEPSNIIHPLSQLAEARQAGQVICCYILFPSLNHKLARLKCQVPPCRSCASWSGSMLETDDRCAGRTPAPANNSSGFPVPALYVAKHYFSMVEYLTSLGRSFRLRYVNGCSSPGSTCDRAAPTPVAEVPTWTRNLQIKSGLWRTGDEWR